MKLPSTWISVDPLGLSTTLLRPTSRKRRSFGRGLTGVTSVTRMKKTIIITSVSTFIRHRSASQSFPLAAWLNRALVGSTCHMGGSRGGWGGGSGRGWGEKGVLFLQANLSSISLPTPLLNLSSLSNVVCEGTRFALRLLYTLLLHAALDCSKS